MAITIMVSQTKEAIINEMCSYNEQHSRNKEPQFPYMPYLFTQKKKHTGTKNNQRNLIMMMFLITVEQCMHTNQKCQHDHKIFKGGIMNDIDTQYRKTGY